MTEQINQGSLKYNLPTNDFSINPTGTADGWVSLPISPSAEHVTKKDLETWAEKLGGQNQSRLYVDQGAPLASDSKTNRGNSKLRPFKTIERALAEAARISFKKNPIGDTSQNDAFERISISIAPGEYEVQNGPRSLIDSFDFYNEYQDASYLVGENRDSIVEATSEELISPYNSSEYQNDLEYITNSIIKDLTTAGNFYTLKTARSFVTSDPSVNKSDPGFYVTRYDSLAKRNTLLTTALNDLALEIKNAIQNLGVSTDDSILIEGAALTAISSTVDNLVNIIYNTLTVGDPLDPRSSEIISYGSYSAASFPIGEPTRADLQRFNSLNSSGIIMPRGVSIIGEDLRKVVIRPTYVPSPSDNNVGRGAIFKMTGANFFSGFTIKDRKSLGQANTSHHKLSAFEFCDKDELDSYYVGVNTAFSDPEIYNRALDSANLIEKNEDWIQNNSTPLYAQAGLEENFARIFEGEIQNILVAIQKDLRGLTNENSISLGRRLNSDHIIPLSNEIAEGQTESPKTQAINYYTNLIADPSDSRRDDIYGLLIDAINNSGGVVDLDITDSGIESIELNGRTFNGRCADIQAAIYTYIQLIVSLLADGDLEIGNLGNFADTFTEDDIEVINPETSIVLGLSPEEEENLNLSPDKINTVIGASPYIFNASIRSEYGMCGIDGDGSRATGLKSYLAAQFTIVSLQKDPAAFVEDSIEVGGKRYRGSKVADTEDYTHFGYRVTNGAYSQLVSCFCIGPARHYAAESGGEFSITNSTSNFGDVSLYSKGFNTTALDGTIDNIGAYPQDKDHELVGIIRPKNYDFSEEKLKNSYFSIGSVLNYQYSTETEIISDYYSNPTGYNSLFSWQNEKLSWKGWVNDYDTKIVVVLSNYDKKDSNGLEDTTEVVPPGYALQYTSNGSEFVVRGDNNTNYIEVLPNDVQTGYLYKIERPAYSEFTSISYVKLTLTGSIKNNITSVEYVDKTLPNGDTIQVPDLKYIYCVKPIVRDSELPDPVASDVDDSFELGYNSGLVERRGLVKDIFEDSNGNTNIVIDVRGWNTPDSNSTGSRGEWFERETFFYSGDNKLGKTRVDVRLKGLNLSIKRFVDDRRYDDRKYQFLFKRKDNTKRLPPDNFILRKQTGVSQSDSSTQPFNYLNSLGEYVKDTVFYVQNIKRVRDLDLEFYTDDSTKLSSLKALNQDPTNENLTNPEGPFLFSCEFISSNSDDEGRANTDDDFLENSKFVWNLDAEDIFNEKGTIDQDSLLSSTTTSVYLTKDTVQKVLSLSGLNAYDLDVKGGSSLVLDRIAFNESSNDFAFAKPSVIRAGGQTWEYMGYYNYSTGIPTYQIENLGDKLSGNEKKIFRIEKLQKYVFGGRVYASGMDELGNIIQGNTIFDLKTGAAETFQLGTTAPIVDGGEDVVGGVTTPPQFIESLSVNDLTSRGQVDFGNASVTLPERIGEDAKDISFFQENFNLLGSGNVVISNAALETSTLQEISTTIEENGTEVRDINTIEVKSDKKLDVTNAGSKLVVNFDSFESPSEADFPDPSNKIYTLARPVQSEEIEDTDLDSAYVTPKALERWRISRGIASATSVSTNLFIGLGWNNPIKDYRELAIEDDPNSVLRSFDPNIVVNDILTTKYSGPLTFNEFETLNNALTEKNHPGLTCETFSTTGVLPDGRIFVPLRDLRQASIYLQKYKPIPTESVELRMKPGIYEINNCVFTCGITIRGASDIDSNGNLTYLHSGRYDGRDQLDYNHILDNNHPYFVDENHPYYSGTTVDLRTYRHIIPTIYSSGPVTDSGTAYSLDGNGSEVKYTWGKYLCGLKSVILAYRLDDFRNNDDYYASDGYLISPNDSLTLNGKDNILRNVIVWGPFELSENACKYMFSKQLMGDSTVDYVESTDVNNNLFGDSALVDYIVGKDFDYTNPYSVPYRYTISPWTSSNVSDIVSLSPEVENYFEDCDKPNTMGYNHISFRYCVPIPTDQLIPVSVLGPGHKYYRLNPSAGTGIGRGAQLTRDEVAFFYALNSGGTQADYSLILLSSKENNSSSSFEQCIFGPVAHSSSIIIVDSLYTGSINVLGCSIRGNNKLRHNKTIFKTYGLVGDIGTDNNDGNGKTLPITSWGGSLEAYDDVQNNDNYALYFHCDSLIYLRDNVSISSFNIGSQYSISGAGRATIGLNDIFGMSFERSSGGNYNYDSELINDYSSDVLTKTVLYNSISTNYEYVDIKFEDIDLTSSSIPSTYILSNSSIKNRIFKANHLLGESGYSGEGSDILTTRGPIIRNSLFNAGDGTGSLISFPSFRTHTNNTAFLDSSSEGGLLIECMKNSDDTDTLTDSELGKVSKGKLYKIVTGGDATNGFESIGAPDNNAETVFVATIDGNGGNTTGQLRLIGGIPKIYTPHDQIPAGLDIISGPTEYRIGEFFPISYNASTLYRGKIGSYTARNYGAWSVVPARHIKHNSLASQLSLDFGQNYINTKGISWSNRTGSTYRRVSPFLTKEAFDYFVLYRKELFTIDAIEGKNVIHFVFMHNIMPDSWDVGRWGSSGFTEDIVTDRSSFYNGSYRPRQFIHLGDNLTELDPNNRLGLTINSNPATYAGLDSEFEKFLPISFNSVELSGSVSIKNRTWVGGSNRLVIM